VREYFKNDLKGIKLHRYEAEFKVNFKTKEDSQTSIQEILKILDSAEFQEYANKANEYIEQHQNN
jgi:hypothetical protein